MVLTLLSFQEKIVNFIFFGPNPKMTRNKVQVVSSTSSFLSKDLQNVENNRIMIKYVLLFVVLRST